MKAGDIVIPNLNEDLLLFRKNGYTKNGDYALLCPIFRVKSWERLVVIEVRRVVETTHNSPVLVANHAVFGWVHEWALRIENT